MALRQNTLEGPSGVGITALNSADYGDAFNAVTAGAFFFDNDAFVGTRSAFLSDGGANQVSALQWDGFSSASLAARCYVKFGTVPASGVEPTFIWFGTGTARRVALSYLSTGFLRFRAATSSSTVIHTTAFAPDPATWYRVEVYAKPGASASTGELNFAIYEGHSTTALATFDSTTTDTGITAFDTVRLGKAVSSTFTGLRLDQVAIETAATGFIGRYEEPVAPGIPKMRIRVLREGAWV